MVTSVHGIQIQLHVAYSVYNNNYLCSWHAYDMCNVTSVGVFYVLLLFACELMLVHVRTAAGQAVQITIMM